MNLKNLISDIIYYITYPMLMLRYYFDNKKERIKQREIRLNSIDVEISQAKIDESSLFADRSAKNGKLSVFEATHTQTILRMQQLLKNNRHSALMSLYSDRKQLYLGMGELNRVYVSHKIDAEMALAAKSIQVNDPEYWDKLQKSYTEFRYGTGEGK